MEMQEIAELSEKYRWSVELEMHVQRSFDEKFIAAARAIAVVVADIYRGTGIKVKRLKGWICDMRPLSQLALLKMQYQ